MTSPIPDWRARTLIFRQIRNNKPAIAKAGALALRRLFVGACVGIYLVGMTWMLWRTR